MIVVFLWCCAVFLQLIGLVLMWVGIALQLPGFLLVRLGTQFFPQEKKP